MADTASSDDLAVLFPGRDLVVKGETIHIRPFYFGELPVASRILIPAATAIAASGFINLTKGGDDKLQIGMELPDDWPVRLMMLMTEAGEQIMQLAAFVTKKPREWFDTLPPDEGIRCVQAILEENRDFFTNRILPIFQTVSPSTSGSPSSDSGKPSDQDTGNATMDGAISSPDSTATVTPG